jgi:hypothetical protein
MIFMVIKFLYMICKITVLIYYDNSKLNFGLNSKLNFGLNYRLFLNQSQNNSKLILN